MAMLEEHRNTIYVYFESRIGKEATQALLSNFPATDLDAPATKADLALVENRLTARMITIAGIGLGAMTLLFAVFT